MQSTILGSALREPGVIMARRVQSRHVSLIRTPMIQITWRIRERARVRARALVRASGARHTVKMQARPERDESSPG